MYAILDIETTGGKYNEEGITEIAIYKFDGHRIKDRFISLINPEREIQPFVVKLTGINSHMLRYAPKFYEVAKRIVEITEGCILVGHNVQFDYRMLSIEFKRLGFTYKKPTLCTLALAKKLIPGKDTYSLGKLARSLGIAVSNRHRADGDAQATTKLFKLLLTKDSTKRILKKSVKEVPVATGSRWLTILEQLPNETGVYYIHKKNSTIIYIGKSKNIKAKVNTHFTGNSILAKKIQKDVASVTYEVTGTLLIASLKAYQEIQKNSPPANLPTQSFRSQKTSRNYSYPHNNMIIIDKGREIEERSAIVIENNAFKGYGFFNLNYQINTHHILRSIIMPMKDNDQINKMIVSYILKNKKLKIITF